MSEKISETCSYSIEFFLGMKDPSADKLAKVVYKTATPQQITQQALQDSKKAGKPLSLALNLVNADPTSPDTPGPQIQIPGDDSLSPIDPSDGSINLPGADDLSPIDDNTGSIGGGSSLEPIGP